MYLLRNAVMLFASFFLFSCSTDSPIETDDDNEKEGVNNNSENDDNSTIQFADVLAFPTAEGYGKNTVGGRGGDVYEVTNLNDSGTGSLRAAVEAKGPRTVVFRVSGTIALKSTLSIRNPYITIAGQTAPGDGVCLKNYSLHIDTDEVIIRYIRVRLGDESGIEDDAITGRYHNNIILDHVSASWSVDETVSIYHCENVTIQWCMITESLFQSVHVKGNHGFGGIWGSNHSTYHHNLIAHHSSRNPRWASGSGYNDYRNNVVYNWGYNSCYGGEKVQSGKEESFNFFTLNFVNNYYKAGPGTTPGAVTYRLINPSYTSESEYGCWYVSGNVIEGNSVISNDNWDGGIQISGDSDMLKKLRLNEPWESMSINEQSAEDAYSAVLQRAGCIYPIRDAVDARIVGEVRDGTATYEGATYKEKKKVADKSKKCGMIDSQQDVGGWPLLENKTAPIDSDHDGMPDSWEKSNGLNMSDASDGRKVSKNGYTNLENYLNSLVD